MEMPQRWPGVEFVLHDHLKQKVNITVEIYIREKKNVSEFHSCVNIKKKKQDLKVLAVDNANIKKKP